MSVPNLLSWTRLILAPSLLVIAWLGRPTLFIVCLAGAFATDAIDGWLSRRLGQTSELGATLDSRADLALSLCTPLGAWWLFSDLLRQEALFVLIVVAGYTVPTLFGVLKFGRAPGYHTYTAKIASVLMAPGALLFLTRGPVWPFRVAALAVLVEAVDETLITALLPTWPGRVPSVAHAAAIRRALQTGREPAAG